MAQPLANDIVDLELADDNDLVIDTDLHFVRGVAGVAQLCRIAVQMFAGEWFLDLDVGIPYFDEILGLPPDIAKLAAITAFRKELLSVEGVLAVLKLEVVFTGATRTLTVTWQVSTSAGDTELDTLSLSARSA